MVDCLATLFDVTGFLTRGHCGPWSESFELAYIASNAIIALSYFLMPCHLYVLWEKRRRDFDYPRILICFAAFTTLCGLTHVGDIVVRWWAGYWLFVLIFALTAAVSIATAMTLPFVTAFFLKLPTPQQFQRELKDAVKLKDDAIDTLTESLTLLRRQVDHLEQMRKTGLWFAEQESVLRVLKRVLDSPINREDRK